MEKGSFIYHLYLSEAALGQAIANVAKTIAKQNGCQAICELETHGGIDFYQIGQSSRDRHMELRVEASYATGWSHLIGLTTDYHRLRVVNWTFPGDKNEVVCAQGAFHDAVLSFRTQLNASLSH